MLIKKTFKKMANRVFSGLLASSVCIAVNAETSNSEKGLFFFGSFGPSFTSVEESDDDTGFKIGAGYQFNEKIYGKLSYICLLYTSPSPRDS